MAQAIGDLFVKLGFDVDDAKLKSFNDSITGVFNNVLKIAGLGGGAYGFAELATHAETNAVALRNLNSELGVNMKYAEGFASVWKSVNPLDGLNKGLEITAHMANYASQMKYGGGAEFGLFGGTALDNTPEKMVARMRQGLPNVMAMFNGDTAKVSQLLQAITGSSDMMNVLKMTDAQMNTALSKRDVTDQQINDTVKAGEAIANLQTGWDNFLNHAIASLAPGTTKAIDAAEKQGFWGFVRSIGESDPFGFKDHIVEKIGENDFYGLGSATTAAAQSVVGAYTDTRKQQAIDFFMSKGHTKSQAEGIVDGLSKEDSTFSVDATNPTSGAYGIAQWLSKDRIAGFQAHEGRPLHGSTFNQQLDYIEWELRHNEHRAGEKLDQAKTREEAASVWKNDYERSVPQVTNNTTINVHGATDPDMVAERVHQRFIDVTYPTINKGPDF